MPHPDPHPDPQRPDPNSVTAMPSLANAQNPQHTPSSPIAPAPTPATPATPDATDAPNAPDTPLSDERLHELVPEAASDPTLRASLHALRDLQTEHDHVFADYLREKQELEERFESRFAPLFARRTDRLREHPIPLFWFKAFDHCEVLRENITDKDAVVLKFLTDVSCDTVTTPASSADEHDPTRLSVGSFVLSFRFADNPFFENDVLTKTYVMHDDDFEELQEARGTKVLWKPGKDVTVRTLKKKTKNGRVLIRKEPTDSFFNFFSPPPAISESEGDVDPQLVEELEDVVEADFELGECIRSDVIPRALLYYLNIAESESDDDDEDEEEEDDDDDSDENEDADHLNESDTVYANTSSANGRKSSISEDEEDDDEEDIGEDDDDEEEEEGSTTRATLPPAAKSPDECKQQ